MSSRSHKFYCCFNRVRKDREDQASWYVHLRQTVVFHCSLDYIWSTEQNSSSKSFNFFSQNVSLSSAMWPGQENQGQLSWVWFNNLSQWKAIMFECYKKMSHHILSLFSTSLLFWKVQTRYYQSANYCLHDCVCTVCTSIESKIICVDAIRSAGMSALPHRAGLRPGCLSGQRTPILQQHAWHSPAPRQRHHHLWEQLSKGSSCCSDPVQWWSDHRGPVRWFNEETCPAATNRGTADPADEEGAQVGQRHELFGPEHLQESAQWFPHEEGGHLLRRYWVGRSGTSTH